MLWELFDFFGKEKNNMDIFPLFLLTSCLFVSLFIVYILANDDFVLLRRHVSMKNLYDLVLITFFIGLFSARFVYVFSHFSIGFLNPLVFSLFPYFPGLSLGGGVIGSLLFLFFYSKFAKLPKDRICDIFSTSLFGTLPVGLFLFAIQGKKTLTNIFSEGILIVVSFMLLVFLIRFFQKGVSFRDGSICFISLSLFSLISFLAEFLITHERFIFFFSIDQLVLFGLFIFFAGLFVWQEYFSFQKKPL